MSIEEILGIRTQGDFDAVAMDVFRFQAERCAPYAEYLALLGVDPGQVRSPWEIPHMPVEVFKSRDVYCGVQPPQIVFTSSTTGGTVPARHMMERTADYEAVFTAAFRLFYGDPAEVALFALLPGYLERQGSSLVYMAERLMRGGRDGGFFLHDHEGLLNAMRACPGPKILLGVSYALWDLAEKRPALPADTIVMETGGMKGRRGEIPRAQFHAILKEAFGVETIHSEYGMAELTSQAYSRGGGVLRCPPWMRVSVREVNDPGARRSTGAGAIDITDLGNLSSCAFLQTGDMGRVAADGSFEIAGRVANSDIRGCNLLVQ